jgi:uncharacterized phiE125 gp8 family phage protein
VGLTVTRGSGDLVTTAEAKAHLRVTHSTDDSYIAALILAAEGVCESKTGRTLGPSTVIYTLDYFDDPIRLPRSPVVAVASVKYVNDAGTLTTISSGNYRVTYNSTPGRIEPDYDYSWPTPKPVSECVEITYTAGFDIDFVPADIKQAMLLLVGHWYENREQVVIGMSVAELPAAVDMLLARYRLGGHVAFSGLKA